MTLRAVPDISVGLVEGLPGMLMPIGPMLIIVGPAFEVGHEFSDHFRRRFGITW
jgi:hypothetical protein